jgi:plasmid maintenance system antidote protein VapI
MEKSAYQKQNDDFERRLNMEDLVIEITEAFHEILNVQEIDIDRLSEMIGRDKDFIENMLNGGRNLTVRMVADIAWHLGYEVKFDLKKK